MPNPIADIIPATWRKAIYALVGLASLLAAIPDLLPSTIGPRIVAVLAVLSSLLAVGNVAPKDRAGGDPPKDVGAVTFQLLFLCLAIVCFVIFALEAHGTITSDDGLTWLGAGLALFAAGHLP